MISALVAGHLAGQPAERVSKTGARYTVAKLRIRSEGNTVHVNVAAFSPLVSAALFELNDGDGLALSGELSLRFWKDHNGVPLPSLELVAHGLLSNHQGLRHSRDVEGTDA
jgi:hypothetical protein